MWHCYFRITPAKGIWTGRLWTVLKQFLLDQMKVQESQESAPKTSSRTPHCNPLPPWLGSHDRSPTTTKRFSPKKPNKMIWRGRKSESASSAAPRCKPTPRSRGNLLRPFRTSRWPGQRLPGKLWSLTAKSPLCKARTGTVTQLWVRARWSKTMPKAPGWPWARAPWYWVQMATPLFFLAEWRG